MKINGRQKYTKTNVRQRTSTMKIWIATGGTGGHVFPALSVATELVSRGHRVTISCDGRVDAMVRRDAPHGARISHVWASGT